MANKTYTSRLKGVASTTDDSQGYDILGHLRDAGTFVATGQMPMRASATGNALADRLAIEDYKAKLKKEDPLLEDKRKNIQSLTQSRDVLSKLRETGMYTDPKTGVTTRLADIIRAEGMGRTIPGQNGPITGVMDEGDLSPMQGSLVEGRRAKTYGQEQQNKIFDQFLNSEKSPYGDMKVNSGSVFGFGGNFPPGTTAKMGPLTIPMNPKLTEGEQGAVSTLETFDPQTKTIAKNVKAGAFSPSGQGLFGDLKRTGQQIAVDMPGKFGRILTSKGSQELRDVQSDLNSIRRYAFGEGGKNLTGTEKDIVNSLLETTGKTDDMIVQDHQKALAILRNRQKVILGGANAAGQPTQQVAPQADPGGFLG